MIEQIQMRFETNRETCPSSVSVTDNGSRTRLTDLTYEETLLFALLKPGKANAQGVKFLASMMKMSEVELRGLVRHLIMEHGICIGTNNGGSRKPGYYLITEENEVDTVYRSLRRRGIKILMRAAKIKKISLEEVFGQGVLE